jgi:hypothetical protein
MPEFHIIQAKVDHERYRRFQLLKTDLEMTWDSLITHALDTMLERFNTSDEESLLTP